MVWAIFDHQMAATMCWENGDQLISSERDRPGMFPSIFTWAGCVKRNPCGEAVETGFNLQICASDVPMKLPILSGFYPIQSSKIKPICTPSNQSPPCWYIPVYTTLREEQKTLMVSEDEKKYIKSPEKSTHGFLVKKSPKITRKIHSWFLGAKHT